MFFCKYMLFVQQKTFLTRTDHLLCLWHNAYCAPVLCFSAQMKRKFPADSHWLSELIFPRLESKIGGILCTRCHWFNHPQ